MMVLSVIGNLGSDAELVNIKDKKYMHMNVACNEQRKKGQR